MEKEASTPSAAFITMTYLPGRILAKRAASRTVTLLDLSIPHLDYQPGQWLDFTIPSASWIGGFSIASGPDHDEVIQIAVKESNHPPARWVTNESKTGDEILVKVGGTCVLSPRGAGARAVFVAGGIGISPMLGLYRHHVAEQRPPVEFFYSTSTQDELVFFHDLTQLLRPDDALTLTLTQSSGWTSPGSESNIHYQLGRGMTHFLTSTKRKDDVIYYICGPPGMQDEAISTLQQHGVSEDGLVYEKWW